MNRALVAALCLAPSVAFGGEIVCIDQGQVDWYEGRPVALGADDTHFAPVEFTVDLDTGRYWEHRIGSRAGTTGGGTLTVLERGDDVARRDFVGFDARNAALVRIMLWRENKPFVRTYRDGGVGVGECLPKTSAAESRQ